MITVSVVMPVYNAEAFLAQATESILQQTLTDFEFIIIDDASTDSSLDIINAYAQQDTRIRVYQSGVNQGVTKTLNHGLALAQGKYIARMDADDISLAKRFEKQVKYLEQHKDVGVCGAWTKTLGTALPITVHFGVDDACIRAEMLVRCALASPTVMFRRQVLIESKLNYDERYKRSAEDYDLYARMLSFTKVANVPEVLLRYRRHRGQAVSRLKTENQRNARIIVQRLWEYQGINLPNSVKTQLTDLPFYQQRGGNEIRKMYQALKYVKIHSDWSRPALKHYLARAWLVTCIKSQRCSRLQVIYYYLRYVRHFGFAGLHVEDLLRFIVR